MTFIAALWIGTTFLQEANSWASKTVEHKRSVSVAGKALNYQARLGYLPLRDPGSNEVDANLFYASYTLDAPDSAKRPLTFCFNGGPGSATIWLHMGGLAPVMAKLNDDGTMPKPPFGFVPNPDTWLPFTDLVFIDAPGTGLSRMVKSDNRRYFGIQGDLDAFTEFIRNYLTATKRWRSPLFLCGESYGGIRCGGLSERLLDNGIALNGMIVVSGTMNFQTLDGGAGNDLNYISFLPTFTATAWHHKRLSPRLMKDREATLAEVEAWVRDHYAPALFRGDALPDADKRAVAKKMAEYTGLSETYCYRANLRVNEFRFFRELLREQGLTVGRLDGRITGRDADWNAEGPEGDPSGDAITPPYVTSLYDYYTRELEFPWVDRKYNVFGPVHPWAWGTEGGGYPDTSRMFRSALAKNKHMRVLFCEGLYDMACPYYGMRYTIDHMSIDPDTRANIEWAYYPAGHMMYIEKGSRAKLKRDVEAFYKRSL